MRIFEGMRLAWDQIRTQKLKSFFTLLGVIVGEEYFEVISGLSLGDTVVSGPYQVVRTLRNGAVIRAIANGGGPVEG